MHKQYNMLIPILSFLYVHLLVLPCFASSLDCSEESSNSENKQVNRILNRSSTNNAHQYCKRTIGELSNIPGASHQIPHECDFSGEVDQFCNKRSRVHISEGQRNKHVKRHEIALKSFEGTSEDGASFVINSLNSQHNMRSGYASNSGFARRIEIRNLPQENMNGLCMQFAKHLSKDFGTEVSQQFNSFFKKQYPPEVSERWNRDILSPMIYFLLMRNPTKGQWERIQTISSYVLVAFYEMDPESARDINSEKCFQFLLWHTEMMYHLTNPNLLSHAKNDDTSKSNRKKSMFSRLLFSLADENSFNSYRINRSRVLDWAQKYLSSFWKDDYGKNYPFSSDSNAPKRLIHNEWMEISGKISQCKSIGNVNKYNLSRQENEPMMSERSLKAIFGLTDVHEDFVRNLQVIKAELAKDNIREELLNNCNMVNLLDIWMDSHIKGQFHFHDPFSGAALVNYIYPTILETSFDDHLNKLKVVDKRRVARNKSAKEQRKRNSQTSLEQEYFDDRT